VLMTPEGKPMASSAANANSENVLNIPSGLPPGDYIIETSEWAVPETHENLSKN